ncbi:phospholipase D family protein [Tateyamaria sp. SN6-1]|uniref:phospholipase D family protein n=1 Tax=Tateyamaria sp. SN6-1 TaxID=3092148 RepID=UPI0039F60ED9
MFLLETGAFRRELGAALSSASQEVIVLSAFIKSDALQWLIETSKTGNIKVVSRWKPNDLIAGASDLDCFHLCNKANIPFGISQSLHGKVYIADSRIFIGSANLTTKGMSLAGLGNDEFGTGFEYGQTERIKVQGYLGSVDWLDAQLVELMAAHIRDMPEKANVQLEGWPQGIAEKLGVQPPSIWLHDLPMCSPKDLLSQTAHAVALEHDLNCFQCGFGGSEADLLQGFMSSQICRWLEYQLEEFDELSFGKATALFHNQILDDPLPYRKTIKEGIANLFEWAAKAEASFSVSRPSYSQVIRRVRCDQ